jgi:hypothetical protein
VAIPAGFSVEADAADDYDSLHSGWHMKKHFYE